jgi:hypothetical protein
MKDKEKTKVGAWLQKVKNKLPELGGDVVDILMSGNPIGAITEKLLPKLKTHKNPISNELTMEFEKEKMMNETEIFRIEVADKDSARKREVAMAQANKADWMMKVTGLVGLGSFMFAIYAVVYIPAVEENKLFVHLLGMIEGSALTLFAYYYGTSKSSKDKDSKIG